MGPPPYGRSLTVPYQKPLSMIERKASQDQSSNDALKVRMNEQMNECEKHC